MYVSWRGSLTVKQLNKKKHGQHGKEFKRDLTGILGEKWHRHLMCNQLYDMLGLIENGGYTLTTILSGYNGIDPTI